MKIEDNKKDKEIKQLRKRIKELEKSETERKRAEEALRQSEERYRTILRIALDGFTIDNLEGRLLEVNDSYCKMTGYTREELFAMSISDLEAVEKPEETAQHIKKIMEQGYDRFETQHKRKDGKIIDLEISANYIDVGEGQVFVSVRDITERKQAEEKLRASRERLRFLLSTSSAVIYSSKATGDFGATFISDNIKSQLGYEPEDYIKDSSFWVEHIHPEDRDRVLANLSELFEKGNHIHEYRFAIPDGTYHWMRDELTLIRDEDGNPKECVGCWLDINERKKAEEELQKLKDELEIKVAEQTKELRKRINELERFRDATVNREFRMKELRDEIEKLKSGNE